MPSRAVSFQAQARPRQAGPQRDRPGRTAPRRASPGYYTDFHEFLITPWNTALILAEQMTTANLTSIGGPADQRVFTGIVEEVDVATGRVLFWWNGADHVPYRDIHLPLPSSAAAPWDWFHINAVTWTPMTTC